MRYANTASYRSVSGGVVVTAEVDRRTPKPGEGLKTGLLTAQTAGCAVGLLFGWSGAGFLIRSRRQSAVPWTTGKGVFGLCWEERVPVIVDLEEEVYRKALTREVFEALPTNERLAMSWDEVERTRHYKTIYAAPLFERSGRASVSPKIRAIVSVDILSTGHFGELASATVENNDFNSILGICEGALIS